MKFKILVLLCFSLRLFAQENPLSVNEAIQFAIRNNQNIRAQELQVLSQRQLKKTGAALPKTDVRFMYGQYNSYSKQDNNITISQVIPFTAFGSQSRFNNSMVAASELRKAASINEVIYQTKQIYFQLAYVYARQQLLLQQDSIFQGFFKSANARYKAGETNLLEKTTAEVQLNDAKNQLRQNESDILVLRTQLKTLLNSSSLPDVPHLGLAELQFETKVDSAMLEANPSLSLTRQQVEVAQAEKKLESAKAGPDLLIGYFNQTLIGTINPENGFVSGRSNRFSGVEVGLAIPLWFAPYQGRVKAAELTYQSARTSFHYQQAALQSQWQQAYQQFEKNRKSLEYYRASAMPNASLILRQSEASFKGGEIQYTEYLMGVRNALQIREAFFATLNDYNQSIILMEFLTGNK